MQRTETDEGLKIKVLNTGKAELAQSTAAAVRTQLDRGQPVRLLVADFEFGRQPEDMTILTAVGSVAEAVQAPLLAAANPDLFGLTDYAELIRADSEETLQKFDATWAEFRDSPAAAAVSLTLPRVWLGCPRRRDGPVESFAFEEIDASDTNQFVWMNAAWVYAARVTAAVVRGGSWDGQAEGLPLHTLRRIRRRAQ